MANIDIIVTAVDKASKQLKSVGDNVTEFGKKHQETFKKMAGIGALSFGAVVGAAKLATDAYKEQEKNEKILQNAIINVAGATQKEVDALKAKAAALQEVGVVGDEVTMIGQAQLATFGTSANSIDKLTETMQDYAVATFGANVNAAQMNQTANTFGKLINGFWLGELQQQGIIMSDYQKNILQTGTEMEKVAIIQEIMASNLKVTNRMMRETAEGATVALNNSLGDLKESIGAGITPVLAQLTEKLVPVVTRLTDWMNANPELTKNIFIAVGAITWLVTVVGTLGLALPAIMTGFALLTGPIWLAVAAVWLFTHIGLQMYKNWDDIKLGLAGIRENIKEKSKSSMDAILEFASTWGRLFLWVMTGWLSEVVIAVVQNWDTIKGAISGAMTFINESVGNTLSSINDIWDTWLNLLRSTAETIGETVKGIFTSVFDGIKTAATSAIDWVKKKIDDIVAKIQSVGAMIGIGTGQASTSSSGGNSTRSPERRGIGGPVISGRPYLVGENGPEIVIPNQSGTVKNSGIGATVNINFGSVSINDGSDMDTFTEKLKSAIESATRDLSLWAI